MAILLLFIFSVIISYLLFNTFTKLQHRQHFIPTISYKDIEFLPRMRYHTKGKIYHLHHWALMAGIALLLFLFSPDIDTLVILKGIAVGGIIHGLTFRDKFLFIYPEGQEPL